MNGAVLVAIAAAIGNFLQGWDNATIAGLSPRKIHVFSENFSCSFWISDSLFAHQIIMETVILS